MRDEPGKKRVHQLVEEASARLISTVTFGEIVYKLSGKPSDLIKEVKAFIKNALQIECVDADCALAEQAGRAKADFGIKYADSYTFALALQKSATIVTSDNDFDSVKKRKIVDVVVVPSAASPKPVIFRKGGSLMFTSGRPYSDGVCPAEMLALSHWDALTEEGQRNVAEKLGINGTGNLDIKTVCYFSRA